MSSKGISKTKSKSVKGTPKSKLPNKSQSLVGMFKNQTTKINTGQKRKSMKDYQNPTHIIHDDDDDDDDDDFQIIKVESKSKYFKSNKHVTSNQNKSKGKRNADSNSTSSKERHSSLCSSVGSKRMSHHMQQNVDNHQKLSPENIQNFVSSQQNSESSQKENKDRQGNKHSKSSEVILLDSDDSSVSDTGSSDVDGVKKTTPGNCDPQRSRSEMPLGPSKKLSLLKRRSSQRIANNAVKIEKDLSITNSSKHKSHRYIESIDSESDSGDQVHDDDFIPAKKQKLKSIFTKRNSLHDTKPKLQDKPHQDKQSIYYSRNSTGCKAQHVSRLSRENSKQQWHQLFQKKTKDECVVMKEENKWSGQKSSAPDISKVEDTSAVRSIEEVLGKDDCSTTLESGDPQEPTGEGNEDGQDSTRSKDSVDHGKDGQVKYLVPYYLENFHTILTAVLGDEDNHELFDEDDNKWIEVFNQMSEGGQKLYVRMFSRKLAWLPAGKISYPEIDADLTDVLHELVDKDLVKTDTQLLDLEETLKVMSAGDLKVLAKSFHINSTGVTKPQICAALIAKSKQSTVSSLFGGGGNGAEIAMLARAKKLLGRTFRLQDGPRRVFVRVLMLFSVIHSWVEDQAANGGTPPLYQMLLVNMGKMVYPQFTVNKQTKLIKDRDGLFRFEQAMLYDNNLSACVEKGNWSAAYDIYVYAEQEFLTHMEDTDLVSFDTSLPSYLRSCTAGSVLVRVLSGTIDVLQRRKDYPAAVVLLRRLLGQDVYCMNYRGYWWERLALNLEVHLKKPVEALGAIGDGLADTDVNVGHRLALYQRAEKLCTGPSSKFKQRMKEFTHEEVIEAPKHILEGRVLAHTIPGLRFSFLLDNPVTEGDDSDDVTVCAVEELVLNHYKNNGYSEGLHAEGSIISNLFNLYFWDVLFMDVPDAFHSPFQTQPLDFHSRHFYTSRKDAIDDRFKAMEGADEQALCEMMAETWNAHYDVRCSGLNWERFRSLEHAQGLVRCIQGKPLAGMLRRYATNPRHTRSGFPDLTLWNPETKAFKICEVKGPGDRLSHKQILWLDHLLKLGVDAEVCHVKAVGSKKLKPVASSSTS